MNQSIWGVREVAEVWASKQLRGHLPVQLSFLTIMQE